MNYEAIVSLSFRFIDLCIIVGLVMYAFRRWGLPVFKQEMAEEQELKRGIIEQIDKNMGMADYLDKKMVHDKQLAERLREQVLQWRFAYERTLQERKQRKHVLDGILAQLHEQRKENLHRHALHKKAMPKALEEVEKELKGLFQGNESLGRAFIEHTLKNFQRNEL